MSSMNDFPGSGERELSIESLQLSQAISNAHNKLVLGFKRDGALEGTNTEGSYRFVNFIEQVPPGFPRLSGYGQLRLLPYSKDAAQAKNVQLELRIPLRPVTESPSSLVRAYMDRHKPNTPISWQERFYVPTNDVFVTATNRHGDTFNALLTPQALQARASKDALDIIPTNPDLQKKGQYFSVEDSDLTSTLQSEINSEWFTVDELEHMLLHYDPALNDGSSPVADVAS